MNRYQKTNYASFHRKLIGLTVFVAVLALAAYPAWRMLAAGGNLDTSFSGDGRYTLPDLNPSEAWGHAQKVSDVRIQIDPNNPENEKVIVPYSYDLDCVFNNKSYDFLVTRLGLTGAKDGTFGDNGVKAISFAGLGFAAGKGTVKALELQSNGKILVAGNLHSCNSPAVGLARLTFDGELDTSFGSGGLWGFLGVSQVADMAVQSDGKIILVGRAQSSGSTWKSAIWRFNTNGTADSSFSSDGFFETTVWPGSGDDGGGLKSVYVQSDGKIVVLSSNGSSYRLRRVTASGTLDSSLQVNSYVGEHGNTIRAVGSNIWVVGAKLKGEKYGAIFARNSTTGLLDASFGDDGELVSAQPSEWADVALVPFSFPSKYVIAGWNSYAANGANDKAVITRYSNTGLLDTTFGTNGNTETTGFYNKDTFPHSRYFSLRIGLSGKIVTAGQGGAFSFEGFYPDIEFGVVARYWGN